MFFVNMNVNCVRGMCSIAHIYYPFYAIMYHPLYFFHREFYSSKASAKFMVDDSLIKLGQVSVRLLHSQLWSLFDQEMIVEKTLISQLSCKLSLLNSHANSHFSTLMQTLTSQLSCKLSLLNSHQLSSSFDQDMIVEKTQLVYIYVRLFTFVGVCR